LSPRTDTDELPTFGVFISYRRSDSPANAGRLYDRLANWLGEENVFMDVDSIGLGVDFADEVDRLLGSCSIMIVIIGRAWLDAHDEDGRKRLDDPDDWVRLEVSHGLANGVRVIPVLVDGATMPSRDQLPEDIKPLARRNAHRLSHAQFGSDLLELFNVIKNEIYKVELAKLAKTALSNADVKRRLAGGESLDGANLILRDFSGFDLSNVSLRGANLWRCDLSDCTLANADLWGANLEGATLDRADLQGTVFSYANLWLASLVEVRNFREAIIERANFFRVSLSRPDADVLSEMKNEVFSFESYEELFAHLAAEGMSEARLRDLYPWAAHPYPNLII
jgi:TIR domain/Pentapeptide repeats (8 copies)